MRKELILFATVVVLIALSGCTTPPTVSLERYEKLLRDYNSLIQENYDLSMENIYLKYAISSLEERINTSSELKQRCETEKQQCEINLGQSKQPPYISIYDRNVTMAFKRKDGSILYWEISIEAYNSQVYNGTLMRGISLNGMEYLGLNDLRKKFGSSKTVTLIRKNGFGRFTVLDLIPYIEAKNFNKVMSELYEEFDSDEEFVEEVWFLVGQITAYSTELQETPRFPLETMIAGGGDCEDLAILTASLLKATNENWTVKLVFMDADNYNSPKEINHAAVWVDTGKYSTYIEATSKTEINPFPEDLVSWEFEV